jgi:hypothetical protein
VLLWRASPSQGMPASMLELWSLSYAANWTPRWLGVLVEKIGPRQDAAGELTLPVASTGRSARSRYNGNGVARLEGASPPACL